MKDFRSESDGTPLPSNCYNERATLVYVRHDSLPSNRLRPVLETKLGYLHSYETTFSFVFSNPNAIAALRTSVFISFRVLSLMQ